MINRERNDGFGDLYTVCTTDSGEEYNGCSSNPDAYKDLPNKKLISTSHVYYVDGVKQKNDTLLYFWKW